MTKPSLLYIPPKVGFAGHQIAAKRRKNLIIIGAIILTMATILVITIFFVKDYQSKAYLLTTHFPRINGLVRGSNVKQSGYTIGKVESINFILPDSQEFKNCFPKNEPFSECQNFIEKHASLSHCFKITMKINDGWKIADNNMASIGKGSPIEGAQITIKPGTFANTNYDTNNQNYRYYQINSKAPDHVPGCLIEEDFFSHLPILLQETTKTLKESIRPTIDSLKVQVEAFEQVLTNDPQRIQKNGVDSILGILKNLEELTKKMNSISQELEENKLRSIVNSANNSSKNIDKLTTNLNKRIDSLNSTILKFNNIAEHLTSLIENNKESISGSIKETHYITREVANNLKPILNNLNQATKNVKDLTKDIQKNPSTILTGNKNFSDIEP